MPRDYVQWKHDFGLLVPYTCKQGLNGLCAVTISASYAKPKKQSKNVLTPVGDVDNIAKSVLDAMQECSVIKNDRQVVSLTVTKGYGPYDMITVSLEPLCERPRASSIPQPHGG